MKTIFTLIFGACLAGLFSCQQKKEGNFRSVPVDEFAALIANPDVQRLDVRTVAEYSEGHIPGSVNVNVLDDSFAAVADSVLQKGQPVALYCRSGKRSKKAASILSQKGCEVYELNTGFQGWQAAGKETEK